MKAPNKGIDRMTRSVSVLMLTGYITFLSILDGAYSAVGQLGRFGF